MAVDSKTFTEPVVRFGVLTDVQYADCDDLPAAYDTSKTRFYRGSLYQVDQAFESWKKSKSEVQFVLQLGDIIDGKNHSSLAGMSRTLAHFERHSIPTFHTVGNHELYNFSRQELALLFYESVMKTNVPPEMFCPLSPMPEPVLYYRFIPVPSIKCISLDCFDVSVLGYSEDHPKYRKASKLLQSKHGHEVFQDWDCDGPLQGLDVRFQQMNGALGKEQMLWLDQELKESDELGQKVIVFGHVSLNADCTDWSCLLWNYDEVIDIFHNHNCVIAYFSGHTHESGYAIDTHGISYVTFMGIIETPPDTSAFATVSVYHDRLEIQGYGLEQSYSISFQQHGAEEKDIILENELDILPSPLKVEV